MYLLKKKRNTVKEVRIINVIQKDNNITIVNDVN